MKTSSRESGVTLVMLLLILVVMSVLGLSSVKSSITDERIAANTRDRDKAFQSAEAAVQACLNQVNAKTYPTAKILEPVEAADVVPTPNWEVDSIWGASGNEVDIGDNSLNEMPKCLVESLSANSFRVTSRAKGAQATTIVMLQATYSLE